MKRSILVAALLSALPMVPANAYKAGDLILRAGAANANPDASSSEVRVAGANVSGSSVDVDDNTQLGLTGTYMFSDVLGIGLLAATPFKHDVSAKGIGINKVATVEHLPPTLTLQYFPRAGDAAVQPYFGLGVNYTRFFSEQTSDELNAALGDSDISLDDSFGLALEAGVDVAFNQNWILNAAVWRLDLDTDATINSPAGQVTVDVTVDPWVYMLGLGYKF
ncbi:outer membrane protein W [Arenicella chitinivorans]|uniref:Outer membrane protein W n=1 Tax=Arenicella chitinivorans TaxID=1329800 RepID=A0A918RL23_9GAMM|nr:OmpW family outer membrane protein [Arenicella chitinivorans]GHA00572.1 outer membrane protein W [Arenicella chitinivorans]